MDYKKPKYKEPSNQMLRKNQAQTSHKNRVCRKYKGDIQFLQKKNKKTDNPK